MAEYIERDNVKEEILSWAVCINHPEHLMREDAIHVLDSIQAADVAPVRHGRWDDSGRYKFTNGDLAIRCTECGCSLREDEFRKFHWNYCPVCGAKMDGDNRNE